MTELSEQAKILVTTFSNLTDAEIANILKQLERVRGVRDVELLAGRYTIHGDRDIER